MLIKECTLQRTDSEREMSPCNTLVRVTPENKTPWGNEASTLSNYTILLRWPLLNFWSNHTGIPACSVPAGSFPDNSENAKKPFQWIPTMHASSKKYCSLLNIAHSSWQALCSRLCYTQLKSKTPHLGVAHRKKKSVCNLSFVILFTMRLHIIRCASNINFWRF